MKQFLVSKQWRTQCPVPCCGLALLWLCWESSSNKKQRYTHPNVPSFTQKISNNSRLWIMPVHRKSNTVEGLVECMIKQHLLGGKKKMLETKYNPKKFGSFPFFEKEHPGFYMVFLSSMWKSFLQLLRSTFPFITLLKGKLLKSSSLRYSVILSVFSITNKIRNNSWNSRIYNLIFF